MENVLTLVVAKKGKLEKHVIKKIVDHLVKLKLKAEFHWLSENEACDIYFSGMDCGSVNTMIRNKFEGLDIDLAVQPIKNREKKLLIFRDQRPVLSQLQKGHFEFQVKRSCDLL